MFERKGYYVCSFSEGREKELFFIELYDFLSRKNYLELLQCSLNQKISNRPSKALFREQTQKNQPPTISISFFFLIFFKICYSNSLDMESTVATPKPFSLLKKILVELKYYFFLSLPFLLFLCFITLSHFSSENKKAVSHSLEKKRS